MSRRTFMQGGAVLAVATIATPRIGRAEGPVEYRLRATPGKASIVGGDGPPTATLAYNGTMPGPVLRFRQGEPVRIIVANGLDQDTTVHWHGIRLPNAMDGVPGLTQPPIKPGETFTYEFTPPDAGTFWYHPHANSLQQIGRGLAGALIVEERQHVAVDRDLIWMVQDWRLRDDGEIASGFGSMMDAAMSGRV
ncbi:MAG: multicopper oxidase family protein, partial [Alphaproteobacteria bacterium]